MPAALQAQDDRPPGTLLTLSVAERLQYDSNLGLTPGGEDATLQATTQLGFGLLTETRAQSLRIDANANARLADGPGDTSGATFDGPDLSFGYSRRAADASVAVQGSFSRRDVTFLRDLEDFVGDDGVIDLPDDFDDLEGEGIRQSVVLDGTLTLRDQARSGVTLTAGLTDLRYFDTTSAELVDSRRARMGANLRLTLSQAAEANLGLRYEDFEEEDDEDEDEGVTLSFDAGATIARPDGQVFATLGVDDTEDGTRATLSFGRSLDLPRGGLSGEIGATRTASGDLTVTGGLSVNRDLPQGGLTFALRQEVRQDSDDEERSITTVSAGFRRDLTPRASLSVDALYADSRATAEGDDVRNLSLGATSSYALSEAWALDLGYRHERRDEDAAGEADNDSLFLAVRRSFAGTF